ncbi:MAG: hypothetical protein II828_08725 [Clostridia bacterium]|nr:hypothetical protein [Clostridia bacterium]
MGHAIDQAARDLMAHYPVFDNGESVEIIGTYTVQYHGGRLFSVRWIDSGMVVLLKADSFHDAAMKVRRYFERHE